MSAVRYVLANRLAATGLVITLAFVFTALMAPYVVPYPQDAYGYVMHTNESLRPPSLEHPFGTDYLGRDVFSRVLMGARFALIVSFGVVGLGLLIGVALGLAAGYFGGSVEFVIMRVVDVFLAMPPLLLAILLAATLGRGLQTTIISLAAVWWPWYTRLMHAKLASLRESALLDSARLAGLPALRVVTRYLLPNSVTPVIVQAGLDLGSAILEASALSFLGIGLTPPTPDWGLMISDGWRYINVAWWISVFPGLALVIAVLGFNLLADFAREFVDPRLRRIYLR